MTISGCVNAADVTGTTAGGILGYWKTTAAIQNCYNTGSVTGSAKAGGIVGQLNKGTIENCYSIGDIGGKASQKGGIFAFSSATVKNCYYTLPEAETLGGTAAAAAHITCTAIPGGWKVEADGVSAHGSHPEQGQNAIGRLALYLEQLPLEGDAGKVQRTWNTT